MNDDDHQGVVQPLDERPIGCECKTCDPTGQVRYHRQTEDIVKRINAS